MNKIFNNPTINEISAYCYKSFAMSNTETNILYLLSAANFKKKKQELINNKRKYIFLSEFSNNLDETILFHDVKLNKYHIYFRIDKDNTSLKYLSLIRSKIPSGKWEFKNHSKVKKHTFLLAWILAGYKPIIKRGIEYPNTLLVEKNIRAKKDSIEEASSILFGKELINIPASDMNTNSMKEVIKDFCLHHNAQLNLVEETNVLKENFPAIYAVGKGSENKPFLASFTWVGKSNGPKISLVGKGVCFDSGGLNIKPSQYMINMKKDMGGAAATLALANLIITRKLPVRLKVIIPCVENSISGNAMRPGDVISTSKGISVEINNTDAEGRLILADAIHESDKDEPDLLIDFATLTGAARVALGPDIPVFFTESDKISDFLLEQGIEMDDPVWRLPLWRAYNKYLNSNIADISNCSSSSPHAGAIVAALFLQKFIMKSKNWIHYDLYAWKDVKEYNINPGGDISCIRVSYNMIEKLFISS